MAADEKFTALNRDLHKYLLDHGHNRDPLLAELAAETAKLGRIAGMQIAAEQGTLMAILVARDRRPQRDRNRHLHRL